MKKTIIAFSCVLLLISCKQEEENLTNVKGDFIFLEDAAVIHGEDYIYGVQIDEKSKELAQQVEPHKQERFDMVQVEINGVIKDNPDTTGWEKVIEIREIVDVSQKRKPSKIKLN